jgi:threonylcarbamoyladenosine tRNA methylthiotransferase MtaB
MRIRLDSIGCRLNIGEIEAMARVFAADGHAIVGPGEPADLCILNTCTVTAIAARKSRHFIRQLRRRNPDAAVVATGCLAELEPDSMRDLGVDLVVGNADKDELPARLAASGMLRAAPQPIDVETILRPSGSRTRAFLKVQDGCDNRCTFCIVTVARGGGRSLAPDTVLSEIRSLLDLGYREIVLSGVHLGSYGQDLGQRHGFANLVGRILRETGVERLRLSSIEPWDLDAGFFSLFSDPRLLPHLHLPLQSGCDATLARMARTTTIEAYTELIQTAREAIDDVSISTDIMVGFPGETDDEFERSIATVAELGFSRLHVFRYSPREGTRAATMPEQVPGPMANERSRRMHELGERLARAHHERHLGRRFDVLWEGSEPGDGGLRWNGLTGNYIRVMTETAAGVDLANTIIGVELTRVVPGGMLGRLIEAGEDVS